MNWWILFQLGQRLVQLNSPPEQYLLDDQAFFSQPAVRQLMPLERPDTLLLDVALFQATNEARLLADLAPLQYDRFLLQAARNHAQSMIKHDFVSHDDVFQLSQMTLSRRVTQYTRRFGLLAENIGQYQTVETAKQYGVRFSSSS
ncbi:MAG: CAP domain-containing protein [Hymenobacter sp.]|nr:MAG: CAP domain-containing protein [Hymenobacter sp.]